MKFGKKIGSAAIAMSLALSGLGIGGAAAYWTRARAEQSAPESRTTSHLQSIAEQHSLGSPAESMEVRYVAPPPVSYATDDFSKDSPDVLLARMIYGEARSCSDRERIAVGYTVLNRINDGKRWNGETIHEVILEPDQYHSFREDNANRPKMMNPHAYEFGEFLECLDVARGVIGGSYVDPTNGATHFNKPGSRKPKWDSMDKIGKITVDDSGRLSAHEFYREN